VNADNVTVELLFEEVVATEHPTSELFETHVSWEHLFAFCDIAWPASYLNLSKA
jgi:hypothetical protein